MSELKGLFDEAMALMDLGRWKMAGLALATSSAALILAKFIASRFASDDDDDDCGRINCLLYSLLAPFASEISTELRMVIPGDKIGVVIGRKGRTLRRIEFETRVSDLHRILCL